MRSPQPRKNVVAIHDDDDSWQPRFLEICLARMADAGVRGVVTASFIIQESSAGQNLTATSSSRFLPDMAGVHYHELLIGNRFPPISFVYDRGVIAEIGAYRSDLPVLGDWDFNLRFAARYPIAFVAEPLANWHRRAADDPFPNSRDSEHHRIMHLLRDEQLRQAGRGAAAVVSAIVPAVRASLQAASPRQPVLDGVGAGIAALIDRASYGDTARILTPMRWNFVDRKDDCWISLSNDPQIHFCPMRPPLQSGRWRILVELSVPADHGLSNSTLTGRGHTRRRSRSLFSRQVLVILAAL